MDGRSVDQMRPLKITPDFISTAEGSVLIELGNTRVICTASVDDGVPVVAAALRYVLEDGSPERELCWYGDETFLPHIWKVLGGPDFSAEVHFGEPRIYNTRRAAADATYAEIETMRETRGVPAAMS